MPSCHTTQVIFPFASLPYRKSNVSSLSFIWYSRHTIWSSSFPSNNALRSMSFNCLVAKPMLVGSFNAMPQSFPAASSSMDSLISLWASSLVMAALTLAPSLTSMLSAAFSIRARTFAINPALTGWFSGRASFKVFLMLLASTCSPNRCILIRAWMRSDAMALVLVCVPDFTLCTISWWEDGRHPWQCL